MLKIYDASMKLLAVFDKLLKCADKQVLNAEYLLNFIVICDKTKSDYLYSKANILEIDNDYFKVYSLREIHKAGSLITLTIQAEHIHYKLVDESNAIENFNMTDTILNIGARILQGTGFNFETDFTETVEIKLEGLYTRQALLIELANKCTGEIGYYRYNIRMMRSIKQNIIYAQFANNIDEISREMNFADDKVTYDINLLDTTDDRLTELKTAHLGDSVFVTDKELNIINVEKKVVEIERDKILGKTSKLVLGDPKPRVIDAIKKTIKNNVLINVIEEKVIVAETAQLMSCWIDEANIQYLETNFKALNVKETFPSGGIRHFIRIENERYDMCYQELSQTETQDYKTKSGKQIYWTSIDDAPQAYKYFTISDPLSLNKDLTEADRERFKVKVRKVLKESVKKSILFMEVTDESGKTTVMPVEVDGEGITLDGKFGYRRGQFLGAKMPNGKEFRQYCRNNTEFTGLKFGEYGLLQYNQYTKKWIPISGGAVIGGVGGVMFWKDKTEFTADMFQNLNLLHYGYNSASADKIVGEFSTFYKPSAVTFLGEEIVDKLPPIVPIPPQPSEYDFYDHFDTDLSKWILVYGTPSVENSYVIWTGASQSIRNSNVLEISSLNFYFETKLFMPSSGQTGFGINIWNTTATKRITLALVKRETFKDLDFTVNAYSVPVTIIGGRQTLTNITGDSVIILKMSCVNGKITFSIDINGTLIVLTPTANVTSEFTVTNIQFNSTSGIGHKIDYAVITGTSPTPQGGM